MLQFPPAAYLDLRWKDSLCNSPDPLEEPTVDGEGRGHGVGPHQESCHDRRLQHRLGGAVRRQTDLRPLVEDGERLPHQLLGNASSLSSLPVFPAGPNRTPCADSLRQHVRGVLYKSPGRCLLEAPLYSGRAPSGMGSAQPALAEGSTPAGQTEPRSGYVISEQCPLRGVDAPSAGGSEDLEDLWQGRSRPFRLQRQLSLPNLLFEGQGRVGPRLAQPPPLCIPPRSPCFHRSSGVSENRVTRCYWWPPCGGTNLGCQSWLSYWQQPPGPCPWDGISSLRRTEQYGTLDPSCGLSTFGRSMGAYWPPRASVWALYVWPLNGSLLASQSEC